MGWVGKEGWRQSGAAVSGRSWTCFPGCSLLPSAAKLRGSGPGEKEEEKKEEEAATTAPCHPQRCPQLHRRSPTSSLPPPGTRCSSRGVTPGEGRTRHSKEKGQTHRFPPLPTKGNSLPTRPDGLLPAAGAPTDTGAVRAGGGASREQGRQGAGLMMWLRP